MSSEIGRVKGHHHEITVSVSSSGVELAIWKDSKDGFGDGFRPDVARGLASLLAGAAHLVEQRFGESGNGYGPRIAWFFQAMVEKLDANAHKGGWEHCTLQYLSMRLTQEREELRRAIERFAPADEVTREAADVANFAMMIADRYRDQERVRELAEKAGL